MSNTRVWPTTYFNGGCFSSTRGARTARVSRTEVLFLVLCLLVSFLSARPGFAETLTTVNTNRHSNFQTDKLWPTKNGAVFFLGTYSLSRNASNKKLWISTGAATHEVNFRNPALQSIDRILGVTTRYVYFLVRYRNEHSVWRTSVTGDLSGTRRIRDFEQDWTSFNAFGRTAGNQFVFVVNLFTNTNQASFVANGVRVLRISDSAQKMTDISKGLPAPGRGGRLQASPDQGEIIKRKLYLFIGEYQKSPEQWEINLSGAGATKLFQLPNTGNANRGPAIKTTVAGSSYLYSVTTRSGYGGNYSNGNCRLWGFPTDASNSGVALVPVSSNTESSIDRTECYGEMVIAYGNRLIFKHLNYDDDEVEIWETRGTSATTKKLFEWSVADLANKNHAWHTSLSVINDRIWLTKNDADDRSEVWRSNSVTSGATIQFDRVWHSALTQVSVSILSAANEPLIKINDNREGVGLYRLGDTGSNLSRVIFGNGLLSNVITTSGEAVFLFKKPIGGTAMLALNLQTNKAKARKYFTASTHGISLPQLQTTYVPLQVAQGKAYYCAADWSFQGERAVPGYGFRLDRTRGSLWQTDGTTAGTRPIYLNKSQPRCTDFTVGRSSLYYVKEIKIDAVITKEEIYRTNLDGSNPVLISDALSGIRYLKELNGILIAATSNQSSEPDRPNQLWRLESGNTWQEIGTPKRYPREIVNSSKNQLWYATRYKSQADDSDRFSLWVTDGTSASSRRLAKGVNSVGVGPGVGILDVLKVGDDTYFTGTVNDTGGLYLSKPGSTEPEIVVQAKMISGTQGPPYQAFSYPLLDGEQRTLTRLGGNLYFVARHQLWRYNLRTGQSLAIQSYSMVNDGKWYERYTPILGLEAFNGALYFIKQRTARTSGIDWELWRTNGKFNRAILLRQERLGGAVRTINGPGFGNRPVFQKDGNALWFIGNTRNSGQEVWRITP